MNSIHRRWFLVCCLVLILTAAAASAQDWPLPAATPNTDVPCSGCFNGKDSLKTIGYPPTLKFVGRFVDSETTKEIQFNFRTVRARGVGFLESSDPAKSRIYMMLGSAPAAYTTDSFFSRVTAHEAMYPASFIPTHPANSRTGQNGPYNELYLQWDRFFYAESGGGWNLGGGDGQDRLYGVDWDDRGYVYLAYSAYGWGIVRDDFGTGGDWMPSVYQHVGEANDVTPILIVLCKVDGDYYVVVSEGTDRAQVWKVTNPANPEKTADLPGRGFNSVTKDALGSRVATVDHNGRLQILTTSAFVNGGTALVSRVLSGGQYKAVTTDGTNFYALSSIAGVANVTVINGSTYGETQIPITNASGNPTSFSTPGGIRAGGGYVVAWGIEDAAGGWNLHIYKAGNGATLTEVPLDNYFAKYYSGGSPAGYTHPSFSAFMDAAPYKRGGKSYLILESFGLGDVYEIRAGDSLTAHLASTPTPFYGDTQTFTSALSSNTPVGVNWTFDDNTAGHTNPGLPQILHQFGGATHETDLPTTRHATATNENDSSMTDTLAVTLAKPNASFKLAGTSYLFKLPDASSTAPVVSSDQFADVSDGASEGHYVAWTLDPTTTTKPSLSTLGVGPCGVHTVNAVAHYGPYDLATFLGRGNSDVAFTLGPVTYASRPFAVNVQPPPPIVGTATGPAVFTPSVRVTSTAADLPAGLVTPVTYLWEVVGASGTTLQSQGGSDKTLGNIPPYSLDRSVFNTLGSKVRLTVTAAASAVSGACAPYRATASATDPLNAPDPTVVKTGCGAAGSPCSFSVTSSGPQTAWTYTWSLTNSSALVIASSSASTFAPTIPSGGSYTATLVVTNAIGSATVNTPFQATQPLCPAPIEAYTAIGFLGATSNCFSSLDTCSAGETITFRIFATGWSPADCNTYQWNFGDGATSTAPQPTHSYATNNTYTVTLALTGVGVTAHVTTSVTVGTPPGGGGPGPTGSCQALTQQSAYVGYGGAISGCTGVFGTCNPAESVFFTLYPQNGYNFSCGNTTFQWAFSDGASGTGQNFTHAFASQGLFTANCTVSNSGGGQVYSTPVQVGPVQNHTCGTITQSNAALTYSGPGCTDAGGDCKPADTVTFSAVGKSSAPYDFSCATHNYQWAFGDGVSGTGASPTHAYSTSGTYHASVTITQGTQNITLLHDVSVNGSSSGGNGGSCPLMFADSNVYIGFIGAASLCSPAGASCSPGESVGFHAYSYGYDYACDTHTFAWDFGDGGHATVQNPPHTYAANGTYKVTLHLSNRTQQIDLTTTVKVGTGVPAPPRGGRAVRH